MSWVTDAVLARRPWLANPGLFSFGFTEAKAQEQQEPGAASAGAARAGATAAGATGVRAARTGATGAASGQVAERLIDAYHRAVADDPRPARSPDMWTEITAGFQTELARLASTGAAGELMGYLRRLPRQAGGHGFLQGEAGFNNLVAHPEEQRLRALWLMDHLVGMAEAAGVLDVRCPEQGDFAAVPAGATAGELRDKIEAATGVAISLPPVFEGLFVLEPETRPVHLRTLSAAYTVWKAVALAHQFLGTGVADLRLAEIGAGMGYTAFAAHNLGVAHHVVYDLPEVNLAQGYFLLMTLPPSAVSLYGEPSGAPAGTPRVSVLPTFAAFDDGATAFDGRATESDGRGTASDGRATALGDRATTFDVTVNVDSLPEIAREEALRYLAHFGEASRLFLSVNQEAQGPQTAAERQSVFRQLAGATPGLHPLLRYPNWLRPGYVDELWACGSWAPPTGWLAGHPA